MRAARPARALAGALVLALVVVSPVAARPDAPGRATRPATEVSASEAADLARAAVTDDDALADLRAVTEVDGRPADLAAATADLGAADRATRLDALADALDAGDGGAADVVTPAEARTAARDVLAGDDFHGGQPPRPFRRPLRWLGGRLRPVLRFLGRIVRPIWNLPGGPIIVVLLVLAAGAGLVAWLIGRRSRAVVGDHPAGGLGLDGTADPRRLDADADRAEAAGALGEALRLRHLAGLLRLAERGRIEIRPATTAGDAAHQLAHPTLDRLTVGFEDVVYGGRDVSAAELAEAGRGWVEVLGAPVGAGRR